MHSFRVFKQLLLLRYFFFSRNDYSSLDRFLLDKQRNSYHSCSQYSTPSFFTFAQFPLSAASLIVMTGRFLQHAARHLSTADTFSGHQVSPSFLAFGSFTLILVVLALGTPTRSSIGHVTFIITNARIDPPKNPVYV